MTIAKTTCDIEDVVLRRAQAAFDNIRFYEMLYGERPATSQAVPSISYSSYHRARGVRDCINPAVSLCGVLPPFHRAFRRLPFTIPESEGDIDRRQERLCAALADIGLTAPTRMLIVTNEANGPFACDLSTCLGWEGHPASIYYHNGDDDALAFQLKAHQPQQLIWCLHRQPPFTLNLSRDQILLAHLLDEPVPAWEGPVLLFCDELNLIGSRPAGRDGFAVDQQQFAWEKGLAGRPCITTLEQEAFPLIRYTLPNAFEVCR